MGLVTRVGTAAAALTLAVGLGACTSSGTGATGESTPQKTVEAFMHALGNEDPDGACAQVSTGGKALTGDAFAQCKVGLQSILAEITDPSELTRLKGAKVTGAQVNGDKATVTKAQVTDVPAGYENDIDLVKLGGTWFIDSKQ